MIERNITLFSRQQLHQLDFFLGIEIAVIDIDTDDSTALQWPSAI